MIIQSYSENAGPGSPRSAPWMSRDMMRPDAGQKERPQPEDMEQEPGREGGIFCRQCRHLLTSQDQRLEIQGSHGHTFSNPAGLLFQIGCFRLVPGCLPASPPEARWSWFSGYSWQVVVCSSCEVHVGWLYAGGSESFYGLILNRLVKGN